MDKKQDFGASDKSDRAVVNGAASVSALRASVPSAARWLPKERSPIWGYARAMGVSMQKLMPEDFTIAYHYGIRIEGTINTMQEAEAVRETIRHLGQMLPSHRKMIAGDIGAEIPEPGWKDALYKMFGTPAQAMSAGTAEPQSGSGRQPASAVRQDAPEPPTPSPTIQGDSNV